MPDGCLQPDRSASGRPDGMAGWVGDEQPGLPL